MSETKTYTGGCHCGKVRYEVELADAGRAMACNCSICSKMGWLLTFVPSTAFKLLSGEDALTDYQFNKKRIHHLFCATCGAHSFGRGVGPDGGEMCAINMRCVDDVDVDALQIQRYDGKSA